MPTEDKYVRSLQIKQISPILSDILTEFKTIQQKISLINTQSYVYVKSLQILNSNITLSLQKIKQKNEKLQQKIKSYEKETKQIDNLQKLITPTKQPKLSTLNLSIINHSHENSFNIKTNEQFQSLSLNNDQLYKDFQQIMDKYNHDKISLKHQNQTIMNQWLQNSHYYQTDFTDKRKNGFFILVKNLITQLSKYESVSQFIHSMEVIQNERTIKQIKSSGNSKQNSQKKWFEDMTKAYLLKMAQILKSQQNQLENHEGMYLIDQNLDYQY